MGRLSPSDILFRDQRRRRVIASEQKGLDQIIVRKRDESLWDLELHFLPSEIDAPRPDAVSPAQIRLTIDGVPDPGARVLEVSTAADDDSLLLVRVRREMRETEHELEREADHLDLPVHTLELLGVPDVDRFFDRALFVFRDGGTDPGAGLLAPRPALPPEDPEINYLAKDYATFRQLMLEAMARFVPSWHERNPADLGVTVIEALAYAADHLSYYQDAVATEAYLATARQRISVRRHVRLLDTTLGEGTNARAWVRIDLARAGRGARGRPIGLPAGTAVLTSSPRAPALIVEGSKDHDRALDEGVVVFETVHDAVLERHHSEMHLYTWGATEYILPAGSYRATLEGHFPGLAAGDVLIFECQHGVGENAATGDPRRRQAVRLCRAPELVEDPVELTDVTEIEWFVEDALETDFPVVHSRAGRVEDHLSRVLGNVVLVDHGRRKSQRLEPVPAAGRFEPRLDILGLTHAVPFDAEAAKVRAARDALRTDPGETLPALVLEETRGAGGEPVDEGSPWTTWTPRRDLLASGPFAQDFVVEAEGPRRFRLRFGDGQNGAPPFPGTVFEAHYRLGRGPSGNVGTHAIRHLVLPPKLAGEIADAGLEIRGVENPLPAAGGRAPEAAAAAQLLAPQALHVRRGAERGAAPRSCVVAEDFAAVAEDHAEVLNAVAERTWSGGWHIGHIHVQRAGGRPVDDAFTVDLRRYFAPRLMAGWDLKISPPRYVPIDLHLAVRPRLGTDPSVARHRILEHFATGEIDFLNPDHFTFGRSVYLSEVIAAAMDIPEVADVEARVFHRWGEPPGDELERGEIPIGPLEIARLDNDPAAPHRGILRVEMAEDA